MVIELDGREMRDRATTHNYLKEHLNLPDYYGRNLDALYDLLTENGEGRTIILSHKSEMEQQLSHYAVALLDTFQDAAEKNPALNFICEEMTTRYLTVPGRSVSINYTSSSKPKYICSQIPWDSTVSTTVSPSKRSNVTVPVIRI